MHPALGTCKKMYSVRIREYLLSNLDVISFSEILKKVPGKFAEICHKGNQKD